MGENYGMNKFGYLIAACYLSGILAGCASNKEKVFEDAEMNTMEDIYDDTFGATKELDAEARTRIIQDDNGDLTDYTRTATTELTTLFPELPNPKLSMYVYPHITNSNMPVPGYSTSFYLYEVTPFAMHGEIRE